MATDNTLKRVKLASLPKSQTGYTTASQEQAGARRETLKAASSLNASFESGKKVSSASNRSLREINTPIR